MSVDRYTFIVPKRAWAKVEFESPRRAYFSNMFVARAHRGNSLCCELVRFAVSYTRVMPEADILTSSKSAQRCAAQLGYRLVQPSDRYEECDLWQCVKPWRRFGESRLSEHSVVAYPRTDGETNVVYLHDDAP